MFVCAELRYDNRLVRLAVFHQCRQHRKIRGVQCTAGCRQSYVIFIQRFEQIRCCDIVSRGFEIQIVCEKCIFNYGDYGCLPVVTFFPLYTFFPSVTRL